MPAFDCVVPVTESALTLARLSYAVTPSAVA
jgi:hypothetical protein